MLVYPKHFFAQKINVQQRTCFVIMPFKAQFDVVYEAIKQAVEHADIEFECIRGDEVLQPHILETILQKLGECEMVIADLTGQNPNVFYELGLAHCVKEPNEVLLLTQKAEDIPFDLRQFRNIIYEATADGLMLMRENIKNSMRSYLGTEFPFSMREGESYKLPKLTGAGFYLYECTIVCQYAGADGAKIEIGFKRFKSDKTEKDMEVKGDYLGSGQKMIELNYIPWDLHFIKIEGSPYKMSAVVRPRAVESNKAMASLKRVLK